jgi:hypothetical protein
VEKVLEIYIYHTPWVELRELKRYREGAESKED